MNKSLVQEQFGAHAAAYVTSTVHAKGASLARLVQLVAPQPQWQVLDVATGAGHTALAFAPHVDKVIASDLTQEMLTEAAKLAAEKGFRNVETAHADAEALPFADASFELVTCRIAPHHFPDIPTFVSEVARVLKPGGTLALVDNIEPDAESTPGFVPIELRDAALIYNTFERMRDPSHSRCLGMTEWSELIEEAGLRVVHKERAAKEMQFEAWATRMGSSPETIERLRRILLEASPALKAFLKPRTVESGLCFTLDEAIIIARKPG